MSTALATEIAALQADPRVRTASLSTEARASQVVRELTTDAIVQRFADRMPDKSGEVGALERDADFKDVVVAIAKNHITAPEAFRFASEVRKVYDKAIDYWQEADVDPEDKKGREVAKNRLSNLWAAANRVVNFRHTQIPEWLRLALNERDLAHRRASEDPMVALEEMARFEEGRPADPTEQMSEADKAEWEKQNAIHRSEFKDKTARTDEEWRVIDENKATILAFFKQKGWTEGRALGNRTELTSPNGKVRAWIPPVGEVHWKYGDNLDYGPNTQAIHKPVEGMDGPALYAELKKDLAMTQRMRMVRIAKKLDPDRQRIVDHLRQERWDVDTDSDPPSATTPDGVTRVWFEPKNVYVVHGRNPDDLVRDEAESMGLGDLGKISGPSFVYQVGEWVRDVTRDGGIPRDRVVPTSDKSAATKLVPEPANLKHFLSKPLPAVRDITDSQLLRDKAVREVITEAVAMSPEALHSAISAAYDYAVEASRRSMDLQSEDPSALKAMRQAHALKMALAYARTYAREPAHRPSWLRTKPKAGTDGVDPSLDPTEELKKMDTNTTEPVDEMAVLEEMARFEEGKPADPTQDMSPEDKAEWKKQHDIHKDNFKAAGAEMQVDLTPALQFGHALNKLAEQWKTQWRTGVMRAADVLKKSADRGEQALHHIIGRAMDAMIEASNAGAKLERAVSNPSHRFVASEVATDPMGPAVTALAIDRALMLERPAPVASDLTTDREAASGLYGFPKRVEKTSEAASNRVARAAQRLARAAYDRDPRVLAFLRARARKGCRAAGLLAHELEEVGALSGKGAPRRAGESGGLYGWGERASDLGLRACADLERAAGTIASELLDKKDAHRVTSFLREHATRAACPRAALLAYAMPDDDEE